MVMQTGARSPEGAYLGHRRGQSRTQARREFISALLAITGDTRLLWLPGYTDTLTTTDASRNARVFTYNESIAAFDIRPSIQGYARVVRFNGTDEEADVPDNDDFSFGDGLTDQAFSVVVLCDPDVNTAAMEFLAKENSAAAEEWRFGLTAAGDPIFVLTDESATATIGRSDATAAGTDWVLLSATYDGSRVLTGVRIYRNAARVDDTNQTTGTYVAMENTAALVHLASRYSVKARFFDGTLGLVILCAKELSLDENWQIKELVNQFFDLSL